MKVGISSTASPFYRCAAAEQRPKPTDAATKDSATYSRRTVRAGADRRVPQIEHETSPFADHVACPQCAYQKNLNEIDHYRTQGRARRGRSAQTCHVSSVADATVGAGHLVEKIKLYQVEQRPHQDTPAKRTMGDGGLATATVD